MSFAIPRDYSFIAPVYDHVFNKALSEGHQKLGALLRRQKKNKDVRILEVGVGSGLMLNYLPNNLNYTGIDINNKMLSIAHKKAEQFKRKKISLAIMDAHRMTFRPESFDLVYGASVLTAVEHPDLVLREMIRVTKRGGHIALVANIRKGHSYRSEIARRFDPLTKKFLGFRTDIDENYFTKFKKLKLVEEEEVNSLLGIPLSSYLLFQKI